MLGKILGSSAKEPHQRAMLGLKRATRHVERPSSVTQHAWVICAFKKYTNPAVALVVSCCRWCIVYDRVYHPITLSQYHTPLTLSHPPVTIFHGRYLHSSWNSSADAKKIGVGSISPRVVRRGTTSFGM